jgi:hypothetical protein
MATDVKVTKRDNYNTLYELVSNAGLDSETEDRLHAFIDHELELMAQRAEKSKKYQKAHKASDDAMTDAIMQVLSGASEPICIADIVDKIEDASAQKVTYRLGRLFKDDKITKDTQTIKTDKGNRRVTFYAVKA